MTLLSIDDLHAGYGPIEVLRGISLSADSGTVTALLGANGVGKTTTMRAVVGLVDVAAGSIRLDGDDITGLPPHEVYRRGITLVPEDRGIFSDLTVEENLRVPLVNEETWQIDDIYDMFPQLDALRDSKGKHLSGGEQQLLAIARAVRRRPQVLLLDEPSEGLAPPAIERLVSVVGDIVNRGTAVLLVEQNVHLAFELASEGYVIDDGRVVLSGSIETLRRERETLRGYLGIR